MKEFRHGNDDYEEEFKDGLRNGKGKKTFFHDRGKNHIFLEYEGEWKDGKQWNGTYYDKEGNIHSKVVNGNYTFSQCPNSIIIKPGTAFPTQSFSAQFK